MIDDVMWVALFEVGLVREHISAATHDNYDFLIHPLILTVLE